MTRKHKQEVKEPLCAAVARIRAAYGDTLERFAQRVSVSMNSVSRFELGKQIPRDPTVLLKLADAAKAIGLAEEHALFRDTHRVATIDDRWQPAAYYGRGGLTTTYGLTAYSLKMWRLMAAAKIVALTFPERVAAVEKALAPALKLADQVLAMSDTNSMDYTAMEFELNRLVMEHEHSEIRKGTKEK